MRTAEDRVPHDAPCPPPRLPPCPRDLHGPGRTALAEEAVRRGGECGGSGGDGGAWAERREGVGGAGRRAVNRG
ncbi:hypothetical protein STTU_3368 [Streptomyces sp. Tu6071]|nr:hypothetical protein STTU_3368 [Streptomyces sp. Tu6071]